MVLITCEVANSSFLFSAGSLKARLDSQLPSSGGAMSAVALGGADLAVAQADAAAAGQPLSLEQQAAFMREKVEQRGAEVQHRLVCASALDLSPIASLTLAPTLTLFLTLTSTLTHTQP